MTVPQPENTHLVDARVDVCKRRATRPEVSHRLFQGQTNHGSSDNQQQGDANNVTSSQLLTRQAWSI